MKKQYAVCLVLASFVIIALAAVAGIGLLLVLAMAESDRRMMRRAQRSIPVEG